MTVELDESTGDAVADRVVSGVVGVFERAFPGRVHGYLLRGSYASGANIDGSDLDLCIVFQEEFADPAEAERARGAAASCAQLSSLPLEALVVSEAQLQRPDNLVLALQLRLTSRPVYGGDVRGKLPALETDTYVRSVVYTPLHSYLYPKQRAGGSLHYPLEHIDPEGEFFGFDQWRMPGPDGQDVPSTKLLVATVGWTATALIALTVGRYVRDKRACVALYRQHLDDDWLPLVADVHELCRDRWRYQLPEAGAERRQLRELCERTLGFQNHYLRRYREYQLAEAKSDDPERRELALHRLEQIQL
ncbi:hypothetical protein JQS43_19550 [Natronosporangium hydrolyticum]|uniref:Polymerase nucleotidyl transferase domain-containing protein n=1 Tax=Natronosporangium hydrolyticum TaxID=2811111 RepID=A0A895YE78_9ACTN|nr:nucleotidyltransferase domain-containing protein [Natronosporangium hydrolyticum]QSB13743.1 hypothetical protein JQS43_19550 [Natronosporangium hydrolyticum]